MNGFEDWQSHALHQWVQCDAHSYSDPAVKPVCVFVLRQSPGVGVSLSVIGVPRV